MNSRSRLTALAAFLMLLNLGSAWAAETDFQLIPVVRLNEFYDDNVELRNTNIIRDYISYLFLGGYLGFYNGERRGDLEYYTVGELFAHNGSLSQFGEGHYARFRDRETLSHASRLSLNDSFLYGNAARTGLLNQAALSQQAAFALITNQTTTSNYFSTRFSHDFGADWKTYLTFRQRFYSTRGLRTTISDEGTARADYGTSKDFRYGGSFDFRDFRFSNLSPTQTYWPQGLMEWRPNPLYSLFGSAGPIFFNEFGVPGVVTKLGYRVSSRYDLERWKFAVYGGQHPGATAGLGGAGINRSGRGRILFNYTKSLSLFAFSGYYEVIGSGANGRLITYGAGGYYKLNRWFTFYSEYLGRQRLISRATNVSLGTGVNTGQTAIGNIYLIGVTASADIFDWSF